MSPYLADLRAILGHDLVMEDVIGAAQISGRLEGRKATPTGVAGIMSGLVRFTCEGGPDMLFTVEAIRRSLPSARIRRGR